MLENIQRTWLYSKRWPLVALLGFVIFIWGIIKDTEDYIEPISLSVIPMGIQLFILYKYPALQEFWLLRQDWGRVGDFVIFLFALVISGFPTYLVGINKKWLISAFGVPIWGFGMEKTLNATSDLNLSSLSIGISYNIAITQWFISDPQAKIAARHLTIVVPLVLTILKFWSKRRTRNPPVLPMYITPERGRTITFTLLKINRRQAELLRESNDSAVVRLLPELPDIQAEVDRHRAVQGGEIDPDNLYHMKQNNVGAHEPMQLFSWVDYSPKTIRIRKLKNQMTMQWGEFKQVWNGFLQWWKDVLSA